MPEWTQPDEEEVKKQEAYACALRARCPQFPPDERQSSFYAYADENRKKGEFKDPEFISMSGLPESHVDLGWLRSRATKAVKDLYAEHGPFYVSTVIDLLVSSCVQRLKAMLVFYDGSRTTIEVVFVTKDDEGSYEYRIGVPTPIEE